LLESKELVKSVVSRLEDGLTRSSFVALIGVDLELFLLGVISSSSLINSFRNPIVS